MALPAAGTSPICNRTRLPGKKIRNLLVMVLLNPIMTGMQRPARENVLPRRLILAHMKAARP